MISVSPSILATLTFPRLFFEYTTKGGLKGFSSQVTSLLYTPQQLGYRTHTRSTLRQASIDIVPLDSLSFQSKALHILGKMCSRLGVPGHSLYMEIEHHLPLQFPVPIQESRLK
jgi:hypothetical protein